MRRVVIFVLSGAVFFLAGYYSFSVLVKNVIFDFVIITSLREYLLTQVIVAVMFFIAWVVFHIVFVKRKFNFIKMSLLHTLWLVVSLSITFSVVYCICYFNVKGAIYDEILIDIKTVPIFMVYLFSLVLSFLIVNMVLHFQYKYKKVT